MRDFFDNRMAEAPPDGVTEPMAALWWLGKGGWQTGSEWEKAHALCQGAEGETAYDRVHALAHWIEGDRSNSDYWYRRAGTSRRYEDPEKEARHILEQLTNQAADQAPTARP